MIKLKIIFITINIIFSITLLASGKCEIHGNISENLGIEVEKLSDKKIKVHYLHRGVMPVGIHMLPDPNIILSYPQNTLAHAPTNRLGPIILDKKNPYKSFIFHLKNKIKKMDQVFYNNDKTRHLGFTSDLIKPLSPNIQLCSWIRSK